FVIFLIVNLCCAAKTPGTTENSGGRTARPIDLSQRPLWPDADDTSAADFSLGGHNVYRSSTFNSSGRAACCDRKGLVRIELGPAGRNGGAGCYSVIANSSWPASRRSPHARHSCLRRHSLDDGGSRLCRLRDPDRSLDGIPARPG